MDNPIQIGNLVQCNKSDDLTKPFLGKVKRIMDNHVIVQILHFDASDRWVADKVQYTTLIKKCNIKTVVVHKRAQ
ncbi:hypothetical protein [Pediococcus argentinicus]|uniref:DUF2187 domain-containing protein n=1 Tax=Pediococcus argentinicus TaxID=480391 RepID=A0A0R2NJQ5_9LACO|nr:hypothetical protein [Pediococcus argentinicus]KRO25090.1 hypothetical protein IV88_GL000423 [Pediococcus argentinicus]NKZ22566.1 hypothetical protein [Pediococcus argentinicus]GEP19596.1 hypothetical protein LSA03_09800 [Pediococcus argentinicus]